MISAILCIARKELLERLASRRYLALGSVSALVLVLAFVSSAGDYRSRLENYESALGEGGETFAVVEPSPLGVLARGMGDQLARRFETAAATGIIRPGECPA